MNRYIAFFLGTPRRVLASVLTLAVIVSAVMHSVAPGVLAEAVRGGVNELIIGLKPLIELAIFFAIIVAVFRWIMGNNRGSGRRN